MLPARATDPDGEPVPTDGLVVEETRDDDTIRRFIQAWRQRVSREYADAFLDDRRDNRHETWFR